MTTAALIYENDGTGVPVSRTAAPQSKRTRSPIVFDREGRPERPLPSLAELEVRIATGLETAFEVGRSLTEIRDRKLYSETDKTFESYCTRRRGLSRRSAYERIGAASVLGNVRTCAQNPPGFSQARELAVLRPEQQRELAGRIDFTRATVAEVRAEVCRIKPLSKTPRQRDEEPVGVYYSTDAIALQSGLFDSDVRDVAATAGRLFENRSVVSGLSCEKRKYYEAEIREAIAKLQVLSRQLGEEGCRNE